MTRPHVKMAIQDNCSNVAANMATADNTAKQCPALYGTHLWHFPAHIRQVVRCGTTGGDMHETACPQSTK